MSLCPCTLVSREHGIKNKCPLVFWSGHLSCQGKWIPGLKPRPEVGDIQCPHAWVNAFSSRNSCTRSVICHLGMPPVPMSRESGIVEDVFPKSPPVLQIGVWAQLNCKSIRLVRLCHREASSRIPALTEIFCVVLRTLATTSILPWSANPRWQGFF